MPTTFAPSLSIPKPLAPSIEWRHAWGTHARPSSPGPDDARGLLASTYHRQGHLHPPDRPCLRQHATTRRRDLAGYMVIRHLGRHRTGIALNRDFGRAIALQGNL